MKRLLLFLLLSAGSFGQTTHTTASQEGNNAFTGNNTHAGTETFSTVTVTGAETAASLNLNSTGVLSTTAQSGTGSLCMTVSCVLTTPNIGSATASSLIFNSAATGRNAVLTIGGTSSTTGGISVFVGPSGGQNERLAVDPADGSTAALRVGALSVRPLSGGFLNGSQVAGIDTTGAISGLSLALGGGTALTTTNRTGTGNLVLDTSPAITSPTINTGVANNGSGFKHKRGVTGCATAASLNAVCSTTITWNTAFADANYTIVGCVGNGVTSGAPALNAVGSKVAASIAVQTLALTAAAAQ